MARSRSALTPDARNSAGAPRDSFTSRASHPVARGVRAVSVVAPLCVVAGLHATIAMLHGAKAKDYLDECGCAYLLVDGDGAVHRTLAG